MSKLDDLKNMKFKINWELIKIGYYGRNSIPPQLTKEDVVNYAEKEIENAERKNYVPLSGLILNSKSDSEFRENLNLLSEYNVFDIELEYRKWRVYLVNCELKNISPNYIEGLLQLNELWVSLGMPSDSPHIIQGRNNAINPQEYYSQEMFDFVFSLNSRWVSQEIQDILCNQ